MFHALILCIENTFDTWIYKKMWNSCDICSFISLYFIHQHIYLCVKCVFNAWYSYIKCTNIWMKELEWFSLLIHCMLNLWCNYEINGSLRWGKSLLGLFKVGIYKMNVLPQNHSQNTILNDQYVYKIKFLLYFFLY
jgi:hypothetical protein